MSKKPRHTTEAVSKACGVSLRELQYWDEQGVLCPIHVGHKRMYTDAEVKQVRRIARLTRAGVQVCRARKYLKWRFTAVMRISIPTIIKGVLVVPDYKAKYR
jgi:DNA-binding transcriptional MerR regulator